MSEAVASGGRSPGGGERAPALARAGVALAARRRRIERALEVAIETVIRICGLSAVLFVAAIFFFVFREGREFLTTKLDLVELVTSAAWYPDSPANRRYGALALIAGTASVSGLAMLFAVPLGLGTAIYISEFARGRVKEILKVTIELFAAIPSVVWGFVGLVVLNPLLIRLLGIPVGLNALNGALLLALMCVPIIVSIGEDALKAVPDGYREAAEAMGATRWQVIWHVLLPAAKNGLLAAVLLGVGRCIGETMAVLMATGHAVTIPTSPLDSVRALTATIAAELGETARGSDHYQVLFVLGMLLFTLTFVVNLVADLIVRGIRKG
jgi:phosphate transport system permease protein